MLSQLIAYDEDGVPVQTLDFMVAKDENGKITGLVDFEAHEAAGGDLTDIWRADNAVGSGTWPEWLGSELWDFKVEHSNGRINALVHKSGHRRTRVEIEERIKDRIAEAKGKPVNISDIVGGPGKPLKLTKQGTTRVNQKNQGTPPNLPVMRGSIQRRQK